MYSPLDRGSVAPIGVAECAADSHDTADNPQREHRKAGLDVGDLKTEAGKDADADHVGDDKRRRRETRNHAARTRDLKSICSCCLSPEPLLQVAGASKFNRFSAALVISNMIGTGVFTSLGFIIRRSSTVRLSADLCCGSSAASWRSAARFATRNWPPCCRAPAANTIFCAASIIRLSGFVAGSLSVTVGFAAPVAVAAMAFGGYFNSVLPGAAAVALGVACDLASPLRLCCGDANRQRLPGWTGPVLKLVLILVFHCGGLLFGHPQPISFAPSHGDRQAHRSAGSPSAFTG